jgi:hypothetical protein
MEFHYDEGTRIQGAGTAVGCFGPWDQTPVRVRYETSAGTLNAMEIEVLPHPL